jgi:hypothetical protein
MPILLLAVRIACAVQFGLRVRTVDGRTLPELTARSYRTQQERNPHEAASLAMKSSFRLINLVKHHHKTSKRESLSPSQSPSSAFGLGGRDNLKVNSTVTVTTMNHEDLSYSSERTSNLDGIGLLFQQVL